MADWKSLPLGLAVVDETAAGLAVHHVTIEGSLTGIWFMPEPSRAEVVARLAHWIVVETKDGIHRAEMILGESLGLADLAGLVAAAEESQDALEAVWLDYKEGELKERANLKPLAAPSWPLITEDGDAATILGRIGMQPFPSNTPEEMRDVLALARLVQYLVTLWRDLETERTSRTYLSDGTPPRPLPPRWQEANPPWWPKAVA